jgi:hypothetical protein
LGSFTTNVPATMQSTSSPAGSTDEPTARRTAPARFQLDYPTWYRKLAGANRRIALTAIAGAPRTADTERRAA